MKLQNFEQKNASIREQFKNFAKNNPDCFKKKLNLSWSNWGFGIESLKTSIQRVAKYGITYIELHGNRYTESLGYNAKEVREIASDYNVKIAGICGMFSPENDMSSNSPVVRQRAIDYINRNVELGYELGAKYFLIVPAAVGRLLKIDEMEFDRSVDTLRLIADVFVKANMRGAVEPIRSAEVSIIHTFAEAEKYIQAVNCKGIQHINGDVYHMLTEEDHIAETILRFGNRLTNLHLADTNRCALGDGSLDLDTLIMTLYLIGYNNDSCFCTPEPLGPGGDPYRAIFGKTDPNILDELVSKTSVYWNEREEIIRSLI